MAFVAVSDFEQQGNKFLGVTIYDTKNVSITVHPDMGGIVHGPIHHHKFSKDSFAIAESVEDLQKAVRGLIDRGRTARD
jgi:hypothetical protein